MKPLSFLILFLLTVKIKSQFELKLYLNTNSCFSCENTLRNLNKLNLQVPLEINIEKGSSTILHEYLDRFDLNSNRYKVRTNKKIIFKLDDHNSSYFKLFLKGKCVSTFTSEHLDDYIVALNSFYLRNGEKRIYRISDSTALSGAISTMIDSNIINFNDFKLGKNITYSLNVGTGQLEKISQITYKQIGYSEFFKLTRMDTDFYHNYKAEVLKRGTVATFEQAYLSENKLYLLISIPYYYWKQKNILRSDSKNIILIKDLINNTQEFKYLNIDQLITQDSTRYFIDNTKNFFVQNSDIAFPVFSSKYRSENPYLYIQTLTIKDTIRAKGFLKLTLSKEIFRKYKLSDDISFSNPCFNYFANSPLFYNYNKDKLTFIQLKKALKGNNLDIKEAGNFTYILNLYKNQLYIVVYDKATNTLLIKQRIKTGNHTLLVSSRFYSNNSILTINANGSNMEQNLIFK